MSTLTQKLQQHEYSINQLLGRLTTFRVQTKMYVENCLRHYVNNEGLLDWEIDNESVPAGSIDSVSLHQSELPIKYSKDLTLIRKGAYLSFDLNHLGFVKVILNAPHFEGQNPQEPIILHENLIHADITADLIIRSVEKLIDASENWNARGVFANTQAGFEIAFV